MTDRFHRMLTRAQLFAALATALIAGAWAAGAAAQSLPPVREAHGQWEIRCTDQGRCFMHQFFNDAEGKPLLSVSIGKAANGAVEAQVLAPLGVNLPAGLLIKIDNADIGRAPFLTCLAEGCTARIPMPPQLIDRMKAGAVSSYFIRRIDTGEEVQASISLNGFTAAFDAL